MDVLGLFAVLLVVWVSAGLLGAFWLARHGHRDPHWFLLGALLGVFFLPIAWERVDRRPRLLSRTEIGRPGSGTLTVLVALDGSAESQQAFADARALLGPQVGTLVLAEVVDYDTGDLDWRGHAAVAENRLAGVAASLPESLVCCEVLAGPPVESLLEFAAAEHVDAIVVGKRGRGATVRLLGSVAEGLVRQAPYPVLVGGHVVSKGPRPVADDGE